jgi:hypothetical protein
MPRVVQILGHVVVPGQRAGVVEFTENYHPSYALDGDPKTAWVDGADGDGIEEWIEWPVSTLANARALRDERRRYRIRGRFRLIYSYARDVSVVLHDGFVE